MRIDQHNWFTSYLVMLFAMYILSMRRITRVKETAVDLTEVKPNAKVLDVATGAGRQAKAFAEKGCRVIGIDLNKDVIKWNIERNKNPNISFMASDATATPFKDNEFDVSSAAFVLHEFPVHIREKVLREMIRVTRPQGFIIIVDFALPVNPVSKLFTYQIIKIFEDPPYDGFVHTDLKDFLSELGVTVSKEKSVLFGGGRVYKILNEKSSPPGLKD
jgi:demethylmenaquinone methyltransferase/2-methoxy-6-polyprenyl-1,4-benzoquinol methylase